MTELHSVDKYQLIAFFGIHPSEKKWRQSPSAKTRE